MRYILLGCLGNSAFGRLKSHIPGYDYFSVGKSKTYFILPQEANQRMGIGAMSFYVLRSFGRLLQKLFGFFKMDRAPKL